DDDVLTGCGKPGEGTAVSSPVAVVRMRRGVRLLPAADDPHRDGSVVLDCTDELGRREGERRTRLRPRAAYLEEWRVDAVDDVVHSGRDLDVRNVRRRGRRFVKCGRLRCRERVLGGGPRRDGDGRDRERDDRERSGDDAEPGASTTQAR